MKKRLKDMPQCEPMLESYIEQKTILDGLWANIGQSAPTHLYDKILRDNAKTPIYKSMIKPIKITELDNGYIVRVGCKKIAISKKKDLIRLLTEYIENPSQTEQKYNEGKLIKP